MYYKMNVDGKNKEELEKELIFFEKEIEKPIHSLEMEYVHKQYKAYIKKIKKALREEQKMKYINKLTVKELIEKLKEYDEDMIVTIDGGDDAWGGWAELKIGEEIIMNY